jgi:4-nitrophenyl phosphatase
MKKLVILGLQGVLVRGEEVIPGAIESVRRLQASGHSVVILTNCSEFSTAELSRRVAAAGIATSDLQLIGGPQMAIRRLKADGHSCILFVGSKQLQEELESAGFKIETLETHDQTAIEEVPLKPEISAVVIALDRTFHFQKAGLSCRYMFETSSKLYCIGGDKQIPAENDVLTAGAMTLAVPITVASTKPVHIIGKPDAESEVDTHGFPEVWVVGDDPAVDIAYANKIGAKSALVLTGVTESFDAEKAGEAGKPTHVCRNLEDALKVIL